MTFQEFEAEYSDLALDVMNSRHRFYEARLRDFLDHLNATIPVKNAVSALAEGFDFDSWYARGLQTRSSMAGSGDLDWARDKTKRLAQQLALFRHFAETKDAHVNFSVHFLYAGNAMDDMVRAINDQLFDPFSRELIKHLKRVGASEVAVPASDRIVTVNHNSADYSNLIAGLDRLIVEVRASNSLKAHYPNDQDRTISELEGGRHILRAATARALALWALLSFPLYWLLDKFAGEAIQPLVSSTISALRHFLGLS